MVRTQVQLTEDQLRTLRRRAARQNVSIAEVVRRAVEALLRSDLGPTDEELRRRAVEVAGRFRSGKRDVAKRHDKYLAEAYRR
jgi:hypothetical protein